MLRSAVFLDRDGVLNEPIARDRRPFSPQVAADFHLIGDSIRACQLLRDAGLVLVVVTNQPDIARGGLTTDALTAMHDELLRRVPVDAIRVCPHDSGDGCSCRKPQPGMMLDAAAALDLDLSRSVVVGDRWSDIEAGRRAGCATVFIERNWDERRPEGQAVTFESLLEAADWILSWTTNLEVSRA